VSYSSQIKTFCNNKGLVSIRKGSLDFSCYQSRGGESRAHETLSDYHKNIELVFFLVKKCFVFFTRIDEATRERYMEQLDKLHEKYRHTTRWDAFEMKDKKRIVKVINLTQKHWFRCPEGKPPEMTGRYFVYSTSFCILLSQTH
jgi:hypothetical protein